MKRPHPCLPLSAIVAFALLGGSARAQEADKKTLAPGGKDSPLEMVIPGQLLGVDPPDKARNVPCKIHVVRLRKDQAYLIDMTSSEFDSYLRLEDTTGRRLAEDDDGGGNLNARLRFTAPRDDLYLVIATSCGGGGGSYTLSIKGYVPIPAKLIALQAPAANKATEFAGQLAPQDAADTSRNVPCRVHTVDLKEGKTYVFDLMSKDFDAYLRVEGPDGANLGEDDDSGGNLNSRITHQARVSGRYRVVAMPLSGPRGGRYSLRVAEQ